MNVTQSHDNLNNAVIAELRQLRRELALYRQEQREESIALRRLFNRFCCSYLDSRFPFGRETDGFRRPSSTGRYR